MADLTPVTKRFVSILFTLSGLGGSIQFNSKQFTAIEEDEEDYKQFMIHDKLLHAEFCLQVLVVIFF
jgi:hypothetical protein